MLIFGGGGKRILPSSIQIGGDGNQSPSISYDLTISCGKKAIMGSICSSQYAKARYTIIPLFIDKIWLHRRYLHQFMQEIFHWLTTYHFECNPNPKRIAGFLSNSKCCPRDCHHLRIAVRIAGRCQVAPCLWQRRLMRGWHRKNGGGWFLLDTNIYLHCF